MVKEQWNGLMEDNIVDNGNKIKWMVKANLCGHQDKNILDIIKIIINKEKVN